jgi:DNA-binding LacI/PurR family transcriptional regulator
MTKKSTSVTIRDVARQAGVSVATVSRYINQNAPVSEELSQKIQQVMDSLDYVPQATAQQLATQRKNTIGLLLNNMHNYFFAPLLFGIEEVVREYGYNLLVATSHPNAIKQNQLPIGRHNTDGLLVFADSLSDKQIAQIHGRDFPMVLIHRTPEPGIEIPFVTIENKAATRQLINHLITEHGCRNILLVRGQTEQEDADWREAGFKAALADHNIPFNEALTLCGSFQRNVAYEEMKAFLGNPHHPPFDAIFTGDDDAAVGIYDALAEARIKIPDSVKVVGFDDSHFSPFLQPSLTTVRAPTEEVGRFATRKLLALIEERPVETTTLLPTQIIIRQSCGCPACAN